MRRVLGTLLPTVLVLATVAALGFAGVGVVRITGDSMRPALRIGDLAVYCRGQGVGVGDVIVYGQSPTSRVVHRVTHVDSRGGIHTQGDANAVSDREPLSPSEVEGCVLFTLPTGWMSRVDLPRRGATLLSQIERWL